MEGTGAIKLVLGRYRRLSHDYQRQATTGETMVYLAMIRLMLARLGRP